MCNTIKTISKVKSGELSICLQCNIYRLEFNNIYLEFEQKEFEQFKTYILDLEMGYWEQRYASTKLKRKIPIPSMQHNLVLMFKQEEINELKTLVLNISDDIYTTLLNIKDIDYTLILN
ncbi:hypothetical protein Q4Q35_05610 [Flavivirga aquimarina]|uniref:IPExxxVDY family protein n=1 Tax=Flavivirga aquimarina TaxID=2027862 RepID=A0ABT8W855_9FLAO|nr:DUF6686 family protein [Flavivirga aquimarina]MDO5969278.1 hypothetical protein [Flavivirga aquimarina]